MKVIGTNLKKNRELIGIFHLHSAVFHTSVAHVPQKVVAARVALVDLVDLAARVDPVDLVTLVDRAVARAILDVDRVAHADLQRADRVDTIATDADLVATGDRVEVLVTGCMDAGTGAAKKLAFGCLNKRI